MLSKVNVNMGGSIFPISKWFCCSDFKSSAYKGSSLIYSFPFDMTISLCTIVRFSIVKHQMLNHFRDGYGKSKSLLLPPLLAFSMNDWCTKSHGIFFPSGYNFSVGAIATQPSFLYDPYIKLLYCCLTYHQIVHSVICST